MIATNSAQRRHDRDSAQAWLDDVFATLRAEIGGDPEQTGDFRNYGAGRFTWTFESDRIALMLELPHLDAIVRQRRAFAPVDWRSRSASDVAGHLLDRYREMLGTGRAPRGGSGRKRTH